MTTVCKAALQYLCDRTLVESCKISCEQKNVKQKTNNRKNVKKIADSFQTFMCYTDTIMEQFIDAILTRFERGAREKNNDNKLFHVCILFYPFSNHHNSMSTVFHMAREPTAAHMMHLVVPEHMLLSRPRVIN